MKGKVLEWPPHRYRLVGFLMGFLVSDCSVGKFESQVGKKGSQVGKFDVQVGKIALQVGIVIFQAIEGYHPQKRILATAKISNKDFKRYSLQ